MGARGTYPAAPRAPRAAAQWKPLRDAAGEVAGYVDAEGRVLVRVARGATTEKRAWSPTFPSGARIPREFTRLTDAKAWVERFWRGYAKHTVGGAA